VGSSRGNIGVAKTEGRKSKRRTGGKERGNREKEEKAEKKEENGDKESSRRVGYLE